LMEKSVEQGMQTFDMSLFKLYNEGKITQEEALKNADSKNNLRLKMTLAESAEGKKKTTPTGPKLEIAPQEEDKEEEEEKPSALAGLSLTPLEVPSDDDEET
jgi:twitching motility protein PilU